MASQRCAFEYGPSVTLTVAAFRVSFSPRADDRVSLTECGELLSLESCRLQGIPPCVLDGPQGGGRPSLVVFFPR